MDVRSGIPDRLDDGPNGPSDSTGPGGLTDEREPLEPAETIDPTDPTEELVLCDVDALDELPTVDDDGDPAPWPPLHDRPRDRRPDRSHDGRHDGRHGRPDQRARDRARDLAASEVLSTSLPLDAATAYDAFCDVESIPLWLSLVHSVRVLARTGAGRPASVAFVGRLQQGTIGYTLFYRYSEDERVVAWGTDPGATTLVAGRAQFIPLGERATLMQYQLALDLPGGALPPWADPFLSGHATSVVMNDFREYVIRVHRRRA